MNIAAGLSGLNAAVTMTKALRDGLKSGQIKPDEIAGRIGEIYDYIIDSKVALVDAQSEVMDLQREVQALKQELETKRSLNVEDGVYWQIHQVAGEGPGGEPEHYGHWDGPFCPTCFDADAKLVRLRDFGEARAKAKKIWRCDLHKIEFWTTRGYTPERG
jgi:hypothetical protein